MRVSVLIPTALRGFAAGQSEVVVSAATAGEALAQLKDVAGEITRAIAAVPEAYRATYRDLRPAA